MRRKSGEEKGRKKSLEDLKISYRYLTEESSYASFITSDIIMVKKFNRNKRSSYGKAFRCSGLRLGRLLFLAFISIDKHAFGLVEKTIQNEDGNLFQSSTTVRPMTCLRIHDIHKKNVYKILIDGEKNKCYEIQEPGNIEKIVKIIESIFMEHRGVRI